MENRNMYKINPFINNPLSEDDMDKMIGRDDELQQIKEMLNKYKQQSNFSEYLLVNGRRGVGKSTLKNKLITDSSNSQFLPVEFTLGSTNENKTVSPVNFFWGILKRTLECMCNYDENWKQDWEDILEFAKDEEHGDDIGRENRVFDIPRKKYRAYKIPDIQFDYNDVIADFNKILDYIRKDKDDPNYRIIFFIDEAQCIYGSDENLMILRNIQEKQKGLIFFLFGRPLINEDPNQIIENVWGMSSRFGKIIQLSNFKTRKDVQDYFIKCLSSVGWDEKDWEETDGYFWNFEKACSYIFQLTKGNPSFVSRICSKMFELCANGISTQMKVKDSIEFIRNEINHDTSTYNMISSLDKKQSYWVNLLLQCQKDTPDNIYNLMINIHQKNSLYHLDYDDFCSLVSGLFFTYQHNCPTFLSFALSKEDVNKVNKIRSYVAQKITTNDSLRVSAIGFDVNQRNENDLMNEINIINKKIMYSPFYCTLSQDDQFLYQIEFEDMSFDNRTAKSVFVNQIAQMIFGEIDLVDYDYSDIYEINSDEIIKSFSNFSSTDNLSNNGIKFLSWYYRAQNRNSETSNIIDNVVKVSIGANIFYITGCKQISKKKKKILLEKGKFTQSYELVGICNNANRIINRLPLNLDDSITTHKINHEDSGFISNSFIKTKNDNLIQKVLLNYSDSIVDSYMTLGVSQVDNALEIYQYLKNGMTINFKFLSNAGYLLSRENTFKYNLLALELLEEAVEELNTSGFDPYKSPDTDFIIPKYNLAIIYFKLDRINDSINQFNEILLDYEKFVLPKKIFEGALEFIDAEKNVEEKRDSIDIPVLIHENIRIIREEI
tara:strand:- start:5634 stop:8129 length:2496 start_codon:yes stop_codon:yes gene_type:complete